MLLYNTVSDRTLLGPSDVVTVLCISTSSNSEGSDDAGEGECGEEDEGEDWEDHGEK